MSQPFETISQHRCFGGTVGFYRHAATSTGCAMRFAMFTPSPRGFPEVPGCRPLAVPEFREELILLLRKPR